MDGVRRPETGHGLNDFRVRPGIGIPAPTSPALRLWVSYFPSLDLSFLIIATMGVNLWPPNMETGLAAQSHPGSLLKIQIF